MMKMCRIDAARKYLEKGHQESNLLKLNLCMIASMPTKFGLFPEAHSFSGLPKKRYISPYGPVRQQLILSSQTHCI
ncbi:hypothetical protein GBA52_003912 [Prunus armeniaca]|nr:hypothetical protein GBA52_003912 [Prunus armeniaca]